MVDLITTSASAFSSRASLLRYHRAGIKAVGIRVIVGGRCHHHKAGTLIGSLLINVAVRLSSFSAKKASISASATVDCLLLTFSTRSVHIKHNHIVVLGKKDCEGHTHIARTHNRNFCFVRQI